MVEDDEGQTLATMQEPVGGRRAAGRRLGGDRYRLGELLGRGGMGEVLDAYDEQIGRDVAIKRILAKDPTDRTLERFIREARVQGRLEHPAIVPVHEIGRDSEGRPFFVMKKLAGTTLREILDASTGTFSQQTLLRAFVDVCLAVELAHTRGVVHRDLKPANIMLGDFGEVYVLDWGVAKAPVESDGVEEGDSDSVLTMAGATIGTPGYMAPEQVRDSATVDRRADVYALGCVLFEILSGKSLHPPGRLGMQSALAGLTTRPSERAAGTVPPELDELCVHATAPQRDQRVPTARELAGRVTRFLDGDRDLAMRRKLAREHYESARIAFERGGDDEDARRLAINEAGRALALDPTLAGPAELVGRLMLEPPKTMPREVEQELAADNLTKSRKHAGASRRILLGYVIVLPFLIAGGAWIYAALVGAVLAANALMLWRQGKTTIGPAWLPPARNAILIMILARVFSPFQVAPALATLTTLSLLFGMTTTRRRSVVGLVVTMLGAVFIPWLAEVSGLLSKTMFHLPGGTLYVTQLDLSDMTRTMLQVIITVALVVAGGVLGSMMMRAEQATRKQMRLQAWHLRQLVTTQPSEAAA